jgi:hypothetical protein
MLGTLAAVTCLGLLVWLLHPGILRSDVWRATSTPLASIIGSGFLVALPLLADLVGAWAVFAIIGLFALAYLIGSAVRDNILHMEVPLAEGTAAPHAVSIERLSRLVLTFAYFVSVAYYLVLFASFLLKFFGSTDAVFAKEIVTVLLAIIGGVGFWRGFRAVESMEVFAVSIKLAVIAGLVASVAAYGIGRLLFPTDQFAFVPGHFEAANLPALLGLLIVVQGFETSRYLGESYPAELRVRTMKLAQLLSAAIYIGFFVLMTPLLGAANSHDGVAAIVDMLRPVSIFLPLLVTIGALASQSSAAIADALGAGGLLHDISGGRIPANHTYPLLALVAGVVTWETDVFSLVSLASRCFALYYALQCLQATSSALRRGDTVRGGAYALAIALATAVFVFGAPAEGG